MVEVTAYPIEKWEAMTRDFYLSGGVYVEREWTRGGYIARRIVPLAEAVKGRIPLHHGWLHIAKGEPLPELTPRVEQAEMGLT